MSSKSSGGLSLFTVVGVVFIVLKLVGVAPIASWSWIWVLSPFWIAFALYLVLLSIFGVIYWLYARRPRAKKKKVAL